MTKRFDFKSLPVCGARTWTTDGPCQHPGNLRNGRCRKHGGNSTGPKNPKTKHGRYSKRVKEARAEAREAIKRLESEGV